MGRTAMRGCGGSVVSGLTVVVIRHLDPAQAKSKTPMDINNKDRRIYSVKYKGKFT